VPVHLARPPYNARLQALIGAAVREGLPGVSLRVEGPGIDFQGAAGVADLMTDEPLTTNHVMYVASLGKTFTAAIALQLCEEGRLDLDSPITTWLPVEVTRRLPSSGKITLHHLLSHTSGLIDYLNDDKAWRADFDRAPRRRWTTTARSFPTFMTSPCFSSRAAVIITRTAITSWRAGFWSGSPDSPSTCSFANASWRLWG
jgi:CubicO group peptidase (beta-lactamase class C family)